MTDFEPTDALDHWRTDPAKEAAGVWVDLGGGVEWKVSRMGGTNVAALADMARLPELPDGASIEDRRLHSANALAQVFVKDWRGMGRPFSKADCYGVLRELPDLVQHLTGVVQDRATFRPDPRPRPDAAAPLARVDEADAAGIGRPGDGGQGGRDLAERARAAEADRESPTLDRALSPGPVGLG